MTVTEFQQKWAGVQLKERSASQEHFLDLCRVLGQKTPAEADPTGEWYCFEKGAGKVEGGEGFADVWRKGCFGWEYKGRKADLDAAYKQLLQYRESLENPPLLVVCDTDLIQIHTNFTNTTKTVYSITIDTLDQHLQVLRDLFGNPDALKPGVSLEKATEDAAKRIGDLAQHLRDRGVDAHEAAHFLMKLIFCLFAEDVDLLPSKLMSKLLDSTHDRPEDFDLYVRQLFAAMRTGGTVAFERVEYFNGGLFDDDTTIPLRPEELKQLARIARLDWSAVEPAVFGTLFERSLDPRKRAQLGAHYTSRADIEDIIQPVLMDPLRVEWAAVRQEGETLAARPDVKKADSASNKRLNKLVRDFMHRLTQVRVLDPACGSGNFLYVALTALKGLEKEVIQTASGWGAQPPFPDVDPAQLFGLEIDPYAAELAQLTVWIGYLQWMHENGYRKNERPILKRLHNIIQQDAILAVDAVGNVSEPEWPEADVIVGNPPFLGEKRLRTELGDEYANALYGLYGERVPNQSDLCCYWFERAREEIIRGRAKRVGLLATNSIRQKSNRPVLQAILRDGSIFMAWSDREWILDGAAVRISMVGFDGGQETTRTLDGVAVESVNADLTALADLTTAQRLTGDKGLCYIGTTKKGPFDIPGDLARQMLAASNPLGRDNAEVVRPWYNGIDIVQRPADKWIIDFGEISEREAALYEVPFEYVVQHVAPLRIDHREPRQRKLWWLLARSCPDLKAAVAPLSRYIATVVVAKHRLFAWVAPNIVPDHRLAIFAREDDYFFGVLHSRVHEKWSLRLGSTLEDRPSYTPSTCFETFPFPQPTEAQRAAISEAARKLHETRQSALDGDEKLTLTGLYNKMPTWLQHLHGDLDAAVLAAYGWPSEIGDEELLERLLALNLERAEGEKKGVLVRP